MILGLSIALGLGILACFVLLDRKEKRTLAAIDALSEAHRLQIVGLLERQDRERESHRAEIQVFSNRLQAPQQAVMQSIVEQSGPDQEYPLSDEEMAEAQEQALYMERMERMEREGIEGLIR